MHFMAVKKSGKCSVVLNYSHFKDSVFTVVIRDAKFSSRYVKDVPFVNRRQYERGTFSFKNGIEMGKAGLDLGAEHHRIKLCWVLPPGLEWIQFSTTFPRRGLALSLGFQRSNAFHLF